MAEWQTQSRPDSLSGDEVHLWLVPLAVPPGGLACFNSILSADEKERAGRFYSAADGERFVIGRGSLRMLLAGYGAGTPDGLEFTYGKLGKPGLFNAPAINFSVSHSGDRALLGFCRNTPIGVDLECARPEIDALGLAKRFFSENEYRELRKLAPSEQQQAFYRAWTRKEAYLKASGEGMSGLARVEVSLGESAIIREVSGHHDAVERWTLKHLAPGPGYVGAVAVECRNPSFKLFRFELPIPHKAN